MPRGAAGAGDVRLPLPPALGRRRAARGDAAPGRSRKRRHCRRPLQPRVAPLGNALGFGPAPTHTSVLCCSRPLPTHPLKRSASEKKEPACPLHTHCTRARAPRTRCTRTAHAPHAPRAHVRVTHACLSVRLSVCRKLEADLESLYNEGFKIAVAPSLRPPGTPRSHAWWFYTPFGHVARC